MLRLSNAPDVPTVFGLVPRPVLNTAPMLESVYQGVAENETEFTEPEALSPVDQLRLCWTQQPGPIPLLKQKNVIDRYPELLSCAGMASIKGWSWPYAFAGQGLLIGALLISLLNWWITHDSGKLHDDILSLQNTAQAELQRQRGVMDATDAEIARISHSRKETFNLHMSQTPLTREQALAELKASLEDSRQSAEQYRRRMELKERELRARASSLAIARSVAPLLFWAALILAAGGVRRSIQNSYPRSRQTRNSGDYFLYFATSEGMLLNLVLLLFAHFALSGENYGLSGFFESVGPLFWIVLWMGFYAVVLRYFAGIARAMYRALQMRAPRSELSPENRILLHIHNNVAAIFAVLLGTFLAACYILYQASQRF